MNPACWMCRKEPLPEGEGAQRLGLCAEHLRERIRKLMCAPQPEVAPK